MSNVLPTIDTFELTDEIDQLPCGDFNHTRGISHHKAEQSGEYVVINPCCGDRVILCRSRANYLKNISAQIHCTSCDKYWPPSAYKFIPVHSWTEPL